MSFKKYMREDKRNERHVGEGMQSGNPKLDFAEQYEGDDAEKMYKQGKAMMEKGKAMMKISGNDMGQKPDDAYGESAGLAPKIGNGKGESDQKETYSGRIKKGSMMKTAFKNKYSKMMG